MGQVSEPQDVSSPAQGTHYEISTETHHALSAWFIGPKAENSDLVKKYFSDIVDRVGKERHDYYPADPEFITSAAQASESYLREVKDTERYLTFITDLLSRYSLPYFSPRYIGHMCFDNSVPATLGYLAAMLHNSNNVAIEASPLTSYVEHCVGQQLCKMLGYRTTEDTKDDFYKGWGHVTCDGSIANLESMWVARNLKYYPLSLKWAIEEDELGFIASNFTIPLTRQEGKPVLFVNAVTLDLLNLKPEVVLDIPNRLSKQFGISQAFLDKVVGKYLVQTVGREPLEKRYGVSQAPKFIVSKMNHYSWPKGAAVLGIGRDNVEQIDVDRNARMDVKQLESRLLALTQAGHPIYAVVAIMGTTEHGAVDPLNEILAVRRKFQEQHGVSFLVHCDAAWGGYFASLLHPAPETYKGGRDVDDDGTYVPEQALSSYTETQLRCMREADSITLDPHKSGYVPYPAGGLCYKDERSKYLITWTGPYIDSGAGDVESMGVYGLEGSKPGAAPVAVYVSNEVIGLHRGGYGALLGEAMFTSVKMYSQWATMSLDSDVLVVTPFTMLPAERAGKSEGEIEKQRRYIKEFITDRPNKELVKDEKAMALVKQMGSDMSINALACNFRVSRGGPLNTDVAEASYLNARIIERLSVTRVDDDARKKPMVIMGTELEKERYGECLKAFKKRMSLDENDEAPLAGLCNVSMTPFPTAGNFVRELADEFRKVAEEEVQNCWRRIQASPAIHSFIMQGTDKIYLTYLPMFNVGSYRQQLIVSAELPRNAALAYMQAQKASPEAIFTVHTSKKALLASLLHERRCTVDIHQGLPIIHGFNAENNGLSLTNVELNNITVIKHTSLAPRHLGQEYPPLMPFFLYGNDKQQHINHVLLKNPNAQLSASSVVLEVDPMSINEELREGDIVILNDIREVATQPYGRSHHPDFFAPGRTFDVSIYTDPFRDQHGIEPLDIHTLFDKLDLDQPKARGKLTLGNSVYVDDMHLNRDTVPELCITPKEQLTRDRLLLSVTEDYQTITEDITRVSSHSNALAAPDIEQHFLQMSYLPEKYALQRTSSLVEDAEAVHVSRFAMRQPSDGYSRVMAMRQGWKDAFDQALVEHEVRSANV